MKTLTHRRFECIDTGGRAVAGLALSPRGETLAACFADRVVLADAPGCESAREIETMATVRDVAFSPDGVRLAAACDDAVRVFDVQGGGEGAAEMRGERGGFHTVAWSPDGRVVAAGHFEPWVALFDAAKGELTTTLDPEVFDDEGRTRVCFSPDGSLLATTAYNGIVLWPMAKVAGSSRVPKRRKKLGVRGHAHIIDAAFSPDGATIAGLVEVEGDCALHLWEIGSGRKLGRTELPHYSTRLAWMPGGALIVVAESGGDGVSLWDAATRRRAGAKLSGAAGLDVTALATHASGKLIAAGTHAGEVFGWEMEETGS